MGVERSRWMVRPLAMGAAVTLSLLGAARPDVATAGPQTAPEVGRPGKDVMWVPSPDPLVDAMLQIAHVTADDVVMDLGSGDGRTVIAAARLGARAIGIEYDAELVAHSQTAAEQAGVAARATFVAADLFEVDLSPATVITMFLLPELNSKLRPRLLALKPGTRIVSNTWDLEDWAADETVQLDPCPGFCTALLWVVPARVEGTWETSAGSLTLHQQFQQLTGVLDVNERPVAIEEGRVTGEDLRFRVGETWYSGRLTGGVIEGMAETNGAHATWWARAITTP